MAQATSAGTVKMLPSSGDDVARSARAGPGRRRRSVRQAAEQVGDDAAERGGVERPQRVGQRAAADAAAGELPGEARLLGQVLDAAERADAVVEAEQQRDEDGVEVERAVGVGGAAWRASRWRWRSWTYSAPTTSAAAAATGVEASLFSLGTLATRGSRPKAAGKRKLGLR